MTKIKFLAFFMGIFLIITNYGYAFQAQKNIPKINDSIDIQKNIQEVNNNINNEILNFELKNIEITKSNNETTELNDNIERITLSETCIINEVTVLDSVYDDEIKSEDLVTPTSTSLDLSMISVTAETQPFTVGKAADFGFVVANHGPAVAKNVNIGINVDGSSVGLIPLGVDIPAGYRCTAGFTINGTSEGTHKIEVIAKVPSGYTDTNPSDNIITQNLVWKGFQMI